MKDVNVTNLRQNLPDYLAQVESGETLRITVHGHAIAEICPPRPSTLDPEAIRARLRNSLLRFDDPLAPALPAGEWAMNN